jgi:Winged helix DNA-binding domain
MVQDLDIARWRLRTQHLVSPYAVSAREAVGSLLAVQAENPGQAAWAVASRTPNPDQAELAALLDEGAVVRTHVLRPTWHFVRAEDIGWLLDLTGPRVRRVTGQQLRDAHGLDEREIGQAVTAVTHVLAGRGQLTRAQLADELRERGIRGSRQTLMILLAHAELDGLICSGPVAGGEHTYALMDERVPAPRRLGRTEALAELALRYFTGHGPATERDLAYWATLTLTDVRAGLAQVGDRLGSFPRTPPADRSSPEATFSRSSTKHTAATRTPAGCSTPPAMCHAPGRPRPGWPWSTPNCSPPCGAPSPPATCSSTCVPTEP